MLNFKLYTLAIIFSAFFGSSFAGTWSEGSMNDPSYFQLHTSELDKLPLQGKVVKLPMTSAHWLHKNGGISWRYQTTGEEAQLLTKKMILDGADTSYLSPSEKYDILRGDYKFGLTKQEHISKKNYKYEWEGHCHGWVVASLKYNIPKKSITIKNKDGVDIVFYPQDILAILSYFEGVKQTSWDYWVIEHKLPWYMENNQYIKDDHNIEELISSIQEKSLRKKIRSKYKSTDDEKTFKQYLLSEVRKYKNEFYTPYVGTKNNKNKAEVSDLNAGAVHLILANSLGLKRQGLIADTDILSPVWNRPIVAYKSEVKNIVERADGIKIVEVITGLDYIKEVERPSAELNGSHVLTLDLHYNLEIDKDGSIIGGSWLKDSDKVDFFWSPNFTNLASKDIYYDYNIISKLLGRSSL